MDDKFLGTIDTVGEIGFDIYFETNSKKVKVRDRFGNDHILFTTNSENDVTIIKLANEYIKSSGLM